MRERGRRAWPSADRSPISKRWADCWRESRRGWSWARPRAKRGGCARYVRHDDRRGTRLVNDASLDGRLTLLSQSGRSADGQHGHYSDH